MLQTNKHFNPSSWMLLQENQLESNSFTTRHWFSMTRLRSKIFSKILVLRFYTLLQTHSHTHEGHYDFKIKKILSIFIYCCTKSETMSFFLRNRFVFVAEHRKQWIFTISTTGKPSNERHIKRKMPTIKPRFKQPFLDLFL